MANVILLIIAIASFLIQVGFSIFYSINIVDISSRVNQIQKVIEAGQLDLQQIKARYYQFNSISFIRDQGANKTHSPITKSIILK